MAMVGYSVVVIFDSFNLAQRRRNAPKFLSTSVLFIISII